MLIQVSDLHSELHIIEFDWPFWVGTKLGGIDFCLLLGQGMAPWVKQGGGTLVEFRGNLRLGYGALGGYIQLHGNWEWLRSLAKWWNLLICDAINRCGTFGRWMEPRAQCLVWVVSRWPMEENHVQVAFNLNWDKFPAWALMLQVGTGLMVRGYWVWMQLPWYAWWVVCWNWLICTPREGRWLGGELLAWQCTCLEIGDFWSRMDYRWL